MEPQRTLRRTVLSAVLMTFVALLFSVPSIAGQQQQAADQHLVKKPIKAIGYRVGGGGTKSDLVATKLLPQASGVANVEARPSVTNIDVTVKGLTRPNQLGDEFLTWVLWAASPEGRTINLGEIQTNKKGKGEIKTTTQLQTFSLFVTAEPYFAVSRPSELIVLENEPRKHTKGKIFIVKDYPLLERGQYEKLGNPLSLSLDLKHVPLEMYEARNAVEIARSRAAEKYAPEIFSKAEASLKMAENDLASKAGKKRLLSQARQTVQFAEDARALAVKRQEEEKLAQERKAAAAKARAEAEARRQAEKQARKQAELAAAREAQLKAEAEATKAREEAARAQARALAAKEQAARADAERARKVAQALRAQLLDQLNAVLATRDTPRGLVVTMAGVLFATGKYDLRPEAQMRLARLAGIVSSHPGLNLQVEGYTDSTGSPEFNQKLSEQRAEAVRDFLIQQGVDQQTITAKGFGEARPVADNSTAAGRQKNRRVEIIVSGQVIGASIGK